jgi:hypothetical protein
MDANGNLIPGALPTRLAAAPTSLAAAPTSYAAPKLSASQKFEGTELNQHLNRHVNKHVLILYLLSLIAMIAIVAIVALKMYSSSKSGMNSGYDAGNYTSATPDNDSFVDAIRTGGRGAISASVKCDGAVDQSAVDEANGLDAIQGNVRLTWPADDDALHSVLHGSS